MKILILTVKKVAFYIFSIICVLICICLYLIKEEGEAALLDRGKSKINKTDIFSRSLGKGLNSQQMLLENIKDDLHLLEAKCAFMELLETKSNEDKDTNPNKVYGKYFQLRQGELARCVGIENEEECGRSGFLNSHFGGITIQIGDGMMIQYSNISSLSEYLLPRSLIITNPDISLGYKDARAGMNFREIQNNAHEGKIEKGFMYNEEQAVYYMEFNDDFYRYLYISDCLNGDASWLLIEME